MIWDLITNSGMVQWIAGLLATAGGALALWFVGRRSGKLSAENKALKENAKVQKDINDAVEDSRADGADWRSRLQRHQAERDR